MLLPRGESRDDPIRAGGVAGPRDKAPENYRRTPPAENSEAKKSVQKPMLSESQTSSFRPRHPPTDLPRWVDSSQYRPAAPSLNQMWNHLASLTPQFSVPAFPLQPPWATGGPPSAEDIRTARYHEERDKGFARGIERASEVRLCYHTHPVMRPNTYAHRLTGPGDCSPQDCRAPQQDAANRRISEGPCLVPAHYDQFVACLGSFCAPIPRKSRDTTCLHRNPPAPTRSPNCHCTTGTLPASTLAAPATSISIPVATKR